MMKLARIDELTGSAGRRPLASLRFLGLSQENVSLICLHVASTDFNHKATSAPSQQTPWCIQVKLVPPEGCGVLGFRIAQDCMHPASAGLQRFWPS
jgi:hypothetical protein